MGKIYHDDLFQELQNSIENREVYLIIKALINGVLGCRMNLGYDTVIAE